MNGLVRNATAPLFVGLVFHLRGALRRDKGEGDIDGLFLHRTHHLDASHRRHVPIRQDEIRWVGFDHLEAFASIVSLVDVVSAETRLAQCSDHDLSHDSAVVYDQNSHLFLGSQRL